MRGTSPRFLGAVIFGLGLFGAAAVAPDAASKTQLANAPANPSLEVLALSRGRGVPDKTFETFQSITALAEAAVDSGQVISLSRQVIGLEGETRLCIVLRDDEALNELGDRIRALAKNVELLQVNENNCPQNQAGQTNKEKSL